MSKLVNGVIPADVVCPFKKQCEKTGTICMRKWLYRKFSCAWARAFDSY